MKKLDDEALGKADIADSPEITAVANTATLERPREDKKTTNETVLDAQDGEEYERAKRIFSKTMGKAFAEGTGEAVDEDKKDAIAEMADLLISAISRAKNGKWIRTGVVAGCLCWPFAHLAFKNFKKAKEEAKENDI